MFYPLKFIDINLWSCTVMFMWSSVHLGAVYLCVCMHMLNSKPKEPPKKFTIKLGNLGVKLFSRKQTKSEIGETNSNQRTGGYHLVYEGKQVCN